MNLFRKYIGIEQIKVCTIRDTIWLVKYVHGSLTPPMMNVEPLMASSISST